MRELQLCVLSSWAQAVEDAGAYLGRLHTLDLKEFVARPNDPDLLRKARLDCDWHAENVRCFAALLDRELSVAGAHVCGPAGLLDLAAACKDGERWLITTGQQPQALGALAGKVFEFLQKSGVRILYYAFDEASRFMPCFRDIAPHLDVLIHDESPLDPAGVAALRPECVRIHRSWVANFLPFAAPFNETPEKKILFLGSQLGLTDHRKRQIEFLHKRFKDRFVASHDHSVSVAERYALNRYKVGLCPEGRKFTTPAMSQSHTDRPFWCGCLGLVPVSENSKQGDRLSDLASRTLILRYDHGDQRSLADACEAALEMPVERRRRIYEHFNRHETIGTVVADAIARAACRGMPARSVLA